MTKRGWLCSSLMLLACAPVIADSQAQHVCVPGANARWNCGNAEQPPLSEPLPERTISQGSQPVPPILLMDPARFRVNQAEATATQTITAPVTNNNTNNTVAPTAATAAPTVTASAVVATGTPVRAPAGVLRDFNSVMRNGYTVQLAAAQSPAGFAQRLRQLGISAEYAFAVPVQRAGSPLWLLCVGEYADASSARAALPIGANGAFPKALAQLHAEHSASR